MLTFEQLVHAVLRLEERISQLSQQAEQLGPYSISEFAKLVDRTPYSVREWARLGRIRAERRGTGRGPYREWVISHDEYLRYRRFGLLPDRSRTMKGNIHA